MTGVSSVFKIILKNLLIWFTNLRRCLTLGLMVAPRRPDSKDLKTVVTLSISVSDNISGWLVLQPHSVGRRKKIQPRNPFILYFNHFNLPRNSPKKLSHSGWLFSPPRLPLPIVANPHISVDGFLLHFKLLLHVGRHFVVVVLVLGGGWWSNCQTAVFDISTYQHEHGRI